MSKWLSEQVQKAVLWRIGIAKFVLYTLMTWGSCWLTATNQIDLTQLSTWDKFQTITGCFVPWAAAMLAWLDKAAIEISEGNIPGLSEDEITNQKP